MDISAVLRELYVCLLFSSYAYFQHCTGVAYPSCGSWSSQWHVKWHCRCLKLTMMQCGWRGNSYHGNQQQFRSFSPESQLLNIYQCEKSESVNHFSHVWLFVIPQTVARQAPLSMGFPSQEYWCEFPFPSPMVFLDTPWESLSSFVFSRKMLPSSGLLDDSKWALLMDPGEWGVGVELGNHRALLAHQSFPTGNFWGAGEHSVKATKLDKSPL